MAESNLNTALIGGKFAGYDTAETTVRSCELDYFQILSPLVIEPVPIRN